MMLTITDIMAADFGAYSVEVTNACGSATSQSALLEEADPADCENVFNRGDCNADMNLNIADPIFIMRFSFQGFAPPVCVSACDFNNDGFVDISDTIYGVTFIFMNGAPPPPPFGDCGPDSVPDDLPCPVYAACDLN